MSTCFDCGKTLQSFTLGVIFHPCRLKIAQWQTDAIFRPYQH